MTNEEAKARMAVVNTCAQRCGSSDPMGWLWDRLSKDLRFKWHPERHQEYDRRHGVMWDELYQLAAEVLRETR